jgi:hypothetical protein
MVVLGEVGVRCVVCLWYGLYCTVEEAKKFDRTASTSILTSKYFEQS